MVNIRKKIRNSFERRFRCALGGVALRCRRPRVVGYLSKSTADVVAETDVDVFQ